LSISHALYKRAGRESWPIDIDFFVDDPITWPFQHQANVPLRALKFDN
jgi:hypothetical protein